MNLDFQNLYTELKYFQYQNDVFNKNNKKETGTLYDYYLPKKALINLFKFLNFFFYSFINTFNFNLILPKKTDFLVIIQEKSIDQISTKIFCKNLKKLKKKYIILNNTKTRLLKDFYLEPSSRNNIFNYNNFINIFTFLIIIFSYLKNYTKFRNFIKRNNFLNLNKNLLKDIYLRFILDFYVSKSINKLFKPDNIYINQFSHGRLNIVKNLKFQNSEIKVFGNAFNGVYFSQQYLFKDYLWDSIDYLFCYGEIDKIALLKIKKQKYMHPPKKIISLGSLRDDEFYKTRKLNYKIKKEVKILYIKSNPTILNDIDNQSLKFFIKAIKKINIKYNTSLKIVVKDRFQKNQQVNFLKLLGKDLSYVKIINSDNILTEDLIQKSDLIIGTFSTSFIYQSIYFRKPIIQINPKKSLVNDIKKIKLLSCNNSNELKKNLNKFLKNPKKFIKIHTKLQQPIRQKFFDSSDSENKLFFYLKKILK